MTPILIESPFAGDIPRNALYAARLCLYALEKGFAPFASHLLYTQFLDDSDPLQRDLGINAGLAFRKVAGRALFGVDYGWSPGMEQARALYDAEGVPYETVRIGENLLTRERDGGEVCRLTRKMQRLASERGL